MTLLLDGHQVQGKNLRVSANLRIDSKDLSGQTSNTDKAHKGFKPKTLTVSLMVPFLSSADLTALMRLAEATAKGGQLHLYRVVNDTAEAFGIRRAEFSEGISAREDDSLKAWQVQFTLSERKSNPELVEQRSKGSDVTAQESPGDQVGEQAGDSSDEPDLSGFEKVLSQVDKWLAPSEPK